MSRTSDRLDLAHHARCRAALPPGFRLYGSSFGAGFSALNEAGSRVDFPQAALVEFERLRAKVAALRRVAEAAKKFMRYNGSGPGSVYEASRAYVYGEQLSAALAALDLTPKPTKETP